MLGKIISIEHGLFWWSNACVLSFNSWKRHVYDMVRAGRTFSTFSEIAIGSSISMSRFTRLGGDLTRGIFLKNHLRIDIIVQIEDGLSTLDSTFLSLCYQRLMSVGTNLWAMIHLKRNIFLLRRRDGLWRTLFSERLKLRCETVVLRSR